MFEEETCAENVAYSPKGGCLDRYAQAWPPFHFPFFTAHPYRPGYA